jgi:hypothetical protein
MARENEESGAMRGQRGDEQAGSRSAMLRNPCFRLFYAPPAQTLPKQPIERTARNPPQFFA